MNDRQARAYIRHYGGSTKEIAHVATVMAIGTKIEGMLKPKTKLFDALDAYTLTPAGKMLAKAASAKD